MNYANGHISLEQETFIAHAISIEALIVPNLKKVGFGPEFWDKWNIWSFLLRISCDKFEDDSNLYGHK